jgi:glycosyltransferase involved in cell wall biosynthesis
VKVGLYDPYLDTLGGGERYLLSIASCFKPGDEVSIFWDSTDTIKDAQEKFGLDLSRLQRERNIFLKNTPTFSRFLKTMKFDVFFYVSDGSIPLLGAKKIYPIIQFPIKNYQAKNFTSVIKQISVKKIFCYSAFVRDLIMKQSLKPVVVVYPPVVPIESSLKKENIILNVGRFTKGNNTKKQEILIDFFKKNQSAFSGWKLVFIGSALPEDKDFVAFLHKKSEGTSIQILQDVPFTVLQDYYSKAKIYWHAAGFGEDIAANPERAEHFGITTVEAMSAGCVPLVFPAGGQKEILEDGVNGLFWHTQEELLQKTLELMNEKKGYAQFSKAAMARAEDFSMDHFCKSLQGLL